MRSSPAVWPVVVVVAVLGFAFGGCGTLSSSLLSESSVLASRTPVAAPPVEPAPIAETVETPATPGSATPEADTWFKDFNLKDWRELSRERHEPGPKDEYPFSFVLLERP